MSDNKINYYINREIKATEVRIVDIGLISFNEAIEMAESQDLDLVQIAGKEIPVCRIVNYEKFIYEQEKKSKNKVKVLEIKEIKIGPNTSSNDIEYRVKHIIDFLGKGHKIKLSMKFKGRQMIYADKGMELINKLIITLSNYSTIDLSPKLENKQIIAILKPIIKK
jgi:translation initiation factor IF-3